jgi:hypothetical protein
MEDMMAGEDRSGMYIDKSTGGSKEQGYGMSVHELDEEMKRREAAGQPLPQGVGKSVPLETGTPLPAIKDMFSGETATAHAPIESMWSYGAPEVRQDMVQRGGSRAQQIMGVGTGTQQRQAGYGQQVQSAANQIGQTAQGYANTTAGMSQTARNALGNVPSTYAPQYSVGEMQRLSGVAGGYQSSVSPYTAALMSYQPGADQQADMTALQGFAPGATARGGVGSLLGYDAPYHSTKQTTVYGGLLGAARAPEGPSAAEQQLQAGTERALAGQLALAQSGRGAGANAFAQRRAAAQMGALQTRAARDAAQLRAQEQEAFRQRQLQAYGAAGTVAGAEQQARLEGEAQRLQALQAGTGLATEQDAQRLAALQAAAQLGEGYDARRLQAMQAAGQLAQGADATRLQAMGLQADVLGDVGRMEMEGRTAADAAQQGWYDRGLTAQQSAADMALQGAQARLGGAQAAADIGYRGDQALLDAYKAGSGVEAGYMAPYYDTYQQEQAQKAALYQAYLNNLAAASQANQQQDLARDKMNQGGLGALAMAAGALMASDARHKVKIRYADVLRGGE